MTHRKRGDIRLSRVSRETTQTNKKPKHYTKMGRQNISSSLKKKRKHTLDKGPSLTRDALPHSPCPKGGKSRRRMASERTPRTACCQNDLRADRPYQPTRTRVHHLHQQAMAMMNTADLRVDHHFRGDRAFIRISLFLTIN